MIAARFAAQRSAAFPRFTHASLVAAWLILLCSGCHREDRVRLAVESAFSEAGRHSVASVSGTDWRVAAVDYMDRGIPADLPPEDLLRLARECGSRELQFPDDDDVYRVAFACRSVIVDRLARGETSESMNALVRMLVDDSLGIDGELRLSVVVAILRRPETAAPALTRASRDHPSRSTELEALARKCEGGLKGP
ncbi:MAG: hypothetical protein RLZZ246_896 [Planctomycetota bacterium]